MESHILAIGAHLGGGLGIWLGPVIGALAVASMLFITGRGLLGTLAAGRRRSVHRLDDSHLDSLEHGGFYEYEPGMYSHSDVGDRPPLKTSGTKS
ncbi:hypothetical protein DZF91_14595 [Actinomadura logoneensis]|uniref:Uncharacterized protein n=1 Tax=Actinomadura logoneensis TaxID=2293572 RepID=A0A372JLV1_9ACTN|nr:hypothetical protein [Actinomadura logoneensis]RFU40920.1 hypothetical protein DZF91_14595 [Actinomadura logoneensis]